MVGRTIAQYVIQDRLGSGGMGEVYRARDTRLNRSVAIKVLPQTESGDDQRHARFIHEAQSASGLNHPNIITVHDILADSGADLLVMELVAGKTLGELIPATGMPTHDVLGIGVQIAGALATAHAAGIVHRDVKPGNIMVTATGLVKVLDFGLAKSTFTGAANETGETRSIASPMTLAGTVLGTVNYMSPEQAEGKLVDGRSDIFSLGILLYEMVTGRAAFKSDSMIATMTAILRDQAKPIRELAPEAPQALIDIIDRCLQKDPAERWQAMEEVRAALQALKQQYDSGAVLSLQMAAAPPPPPARSKKPVLALALVGGLGMVAIGGGVWWLAQRARPAPEPPPPVTQPEPTPAPPPAPAPEPVLKNDAVIEMVKSSVPVPVILDQIRSTKTSFDLSTQEVIRLSKAGVPAAVIQAMRDPSKIPVASTAKPSPGMSIPRPAPPPPQQHPAPAPKETLAPAPTVPVPVQPAPTPVVAPPPVPAAPAAPTVTVAVTDGLPFTIELAEDVSNEVAAGTPLRFRATKEVVIDGVTVIAKGALITGQVMEESRRRALVMSVKATYELRTADAAGGHKLKVRASPTAGQARRPLDTGARKKPKEMAAVAGTPYIAYIDGAQRLSVRK
jgi:serine/threonine-protein kinase